MDKTYVARVEGWPKEAELDCLRRGITLEDGPTNPADVRIVEMYDDCTSVLSITIHEGRKHQVKRMCEAIGHPVLALHRNSFGPLSLGDEPEGTWRELTPSEVRSLMQACGLERSDAP